MKKTLLITALAFALFSCNDKSGTTAAGSSFKTAYVDTAKLMEESTELKDLESKGKVKSEEMGRELDAKVQQFRLDAASFQNEARTKGPQWAQLKGQELQKREQELAMEQQALARQLQEEFGVKRDSAVERMRKHIKDFGKKHGYDYIYGTGDAASVLYAKESYDITKQVIKEINDKYGPATEKADDKKEDDKEAKK